MRAGGGTDMEADLLARIIAIAATTPLPSNDGNKVVADLYVATGAPIDNVVTFEQVEQFLNDNLLTRWKDGLDRLLEAGIVEPAEVRKAFPRNEGIKTFVDAYIKKRKARATA